MNALELAHDAENGCPTPLELDSNTDADFVVPSAVPWLKIMQARQIWALLIANFCQGWSFWVIVSWMPTYYLDVFKIDIMHLGVVAGNFNHCAKHLRSYPIHCPGIDNKLEWSIR